MYEKCDNISTSCTICLPNRTIIGQSCRKNRHQSEWDLGMNLNVGSGNEALEHEELPDQIYQAIVRSLYEDAKSLFLGIVCMVIAPLVLYWKIDDPLQLIFCAMFMFLGIARLLLAQYFNASTDDQTSVADLQRWERHYLVISCAYVGLIGCWFMACVISTNDQFAHMLSLCLSLSFMIGIIGRNFGSGIVVNGQVALISFLITAALIYTASYYHILLAAFLLPFFMSMRIMAMRIRNILVSSEINSLQNETIAKRFNIALDNMMHGIAMFDADGKIVVANERFGELAGLSDWDFVGSDLSLLDASLDKGSFGKKLAMHIKSYMKTKRSGRFTFQNREKRTIEADFNSMVEGGVVVLADISERVESEKVIRDLANFDPLTNLPNRRYFVGQLREMLGEGEPANPCAMFFIDLDKFKQVNDTLGHSFGDKLLNIAARRLDQLVDQDGAICRFGGDEFVILLPGMSQREEISAFAERVIEEMGRPSVISGNTISVGASVGIATAPADGNTAEELLKFADSALYDAKGTGCGTFSYYTEQLGESLKQRRRLETDLRTAIENGEIDLHFQPLVNLQLGKITTCEALARWTHPELGPISPGVFITLAEEIGYITQLGEFVLKRAMEECARWPRSVRVAVNVSSVQFERTDICSLVTDLLKETGLPAERLEVEVTETVMLNNIQDATTTLHKLAALGVRISLDDFGTGFSSLSYLHNMPFDKVKIDRSFIKHGLAEERSLVLLKGIVDLIKRLGLSVVLEGIETEDQMRVLSKNVEVNELQGFLFSRPLPAKDIKTLLDASNANGLGRKQSAVA